MKKPTAQLTGLHAGLTACRSHKSHLLVAWWMLSLLHQFCINIRHLTGKISTKLIIIFV